MRLLFICLIAVTSAACSTTHSYYVPEAGGYYTQPAPRAESRYADVGASVYWASPAYGYGDRFVFGFDHFGYSPSYIAYHYPIYLSGFYYDYFYSPRFYLSFNHWPRYAYHPYYYGYRPAYTYPHSWHYRPWRDSYRHRRATAYTPRGELIRQRHSYQGYRGYGERHVVRRDLVAATQRYAPPGGRAAYRLERPGDAAASGFQRGAVQSSTATRREHRQAQRPRGMLGGRLGSDGRYSTVRSYTPSVSRSYQPRQASQPSQRLRSTRDALRQSTRGSRAMRDAPQPAARPSTWARPESSSSRERGQRSVNRYQLPQRAVPERARIETAPQTRASKRPRATPREVLRSPIRGGSAPRPSSPRPASRAPSRSERPAVRPSRAERASPRPRPVERSRVSPR